MLIMMATSITYTGVSMNQVAELAETVAEKQVTDYEQFTEEYSIVKISIENQQFNMTVKILKKSFLKISYLQIKE